MKNIIRLTEGDLHRMIKRSVNKALRESRGKSRILREWDYDYPTYEDENGDVYYGNYYYKTNNFKGTGQKFWVLTNDGTPEYAFISPEEAAQYVAASIQDGRIEDDIDGEEIYNEIMQSCNEDGWFYKSKYTRPAHEYECTQTELVKKRQ